MRKMFSQNQIEEMIKNNGTIKPGNYIVGKDGYLKFVEDIPEDYSGDAVYFGNDGIQYMLVEDGAPYEYAGLGAYGVDKVTPEAIFQGLTHSFAELDETLKAIVKNALDNQGTPVSCSQAQWIEIKSLLDKSLYLKYNTYSLCKVLSDGMEFYIFGDTGSEIGVRLQIQFITDDLKLTIYTNEI